MKDFKALEGVCSRLLLVDTLSWGLAYTKAFSRITYKVYFDAGLCSLALASGYPQNSVGDILHVATMFYLN